MKGLKINYDHNAIGTILRSEKVKSVLAEEADKKINELKSVKSSFWKSFEPVKRYYKGGKSRPHFIIMAREKTSNIWRKIPAVIFERANLKLAKRKGRY